MRADEDPGGRPAAGQAPWRERLALVAFGIVLALVLLEAGLRLGGAVWLWAREQRNAAALRSGGLVRVLCIGESTTALGGETSYPRELERVLDRDGGGRRFSVVNAGVPGITTDALLDRLEEQLDRYRPDVVVTMLGVNDDLVAGDDVRRLPAFSSLRVVKLVHLLIQHVRQLLGGDGAATPAANPAVARAVAALAAGQHGEAESILRAAASGPAPPPEVVKALVTVLTGLARFDDALQVARTWLDGHPDDAGMRELSWQVEIARAALATQERRLDEAEAMLTRLDRLLPDTAHKQRAAVLAQRSAIAELRGDHDAAAQHRAAADAMRVRTWRPSTERNYRTLVQIVGRRGIRLVAMQYPLRPVASLRAMLGDPPGVVFVSNDAPFRDALRRAPWETWFTDSFAGDFGHTTPAGSRLLAESAARAILRDVTGPPGGEAAPPPAGGHRP